MFLCNQDITDAAEMHSARQQQLWFASFIIASIIFHGMILWVSGYTLFGDEQPLNQMKRIVVNLPQSKVRHKNDALKGKELEKKEAINKTEIIKPETEQSEPGQKILSAQQLILRSLKFIQLQQSKEMAQPTYRSFEMPATDPLFITSDKQPVDIESYQTDTGSTKVRIKSIFGGYQCYEVPDSDETDAFSTKTTWMFTRCW